MLAHVLDYAARGVNTVGDADESKPDNDPLYVFPIIAVVALVLFGVAVALSGGFLGVPVGPVRYIFGGVLLISGLALGIVAVMSRSGIVFAVGCFLVGIAMATLLGIPSCTDCGG